MKVAFLVNNNLKELDLSNNINLEYLTIDNNNIKYIDLSNNTKLRGLGIKYNYFDCSSWVYLSDFKKLGTPVYYNWGGIEKGFAYSP